MVFKEGQEIVELTNDLIERIIARLPVKPLLRFRCVSKHFRALIDTNNFVKQHLNHSIKSKTNKNLVFESDSNLYSVCMYSLDQAVEIVHLLNTKQPINHLLGSCNGLLCVMYANPIVIWNPATKKHVKLPPITSSLLDVIHVNPNTERFILVHGFGYDSVSDDYKVVLFIQYLFLEDCSFDTETKVYSLRSGSWRIINDYPEYVFRDKQVPGALACGALHWVVGMHEGNMGPFSHFIAAFDLVTEKHRKVTLPDLHPDEIPELLVSELGGGLSVVCTYFKAGVVDVWAMKDYGVRESWTKLFTFSNPGIVGIVDHMNPLAYSESGDEVLVMVNPEKLVLYDLEKKTFKFLHVCGLSKFFHARIYFESLVSPGKKARDDEKQDGEKEEAKKEWEEKFLSVGFKLVL